ncbi:hypothetical protein evm_012442 [Chilo suppressalis]|nr:hypothetical protein evm_012442 [Chilo suppressalis]
MDGIGRLGHDTPRGPSVDWWVLTTANAAGTNGLTCLPKHGGARDSKFLVTHPMTDHCESLLSGTPIYLDTVYLNPPQRIWNVLVQKSCPVNGLVMKVCDPDAPQIPTVDILSRTEAIVLRHGLLLQSATVDTTVYCRNYQEEYRELQ